MKKIYVLFAALMISCFVLSCSSDDNSSKECYKVVGYGREGSKFFLFIDNDVKKYVSKRFYVEEGTFDHYKKRTNECVDQGTIDNYFKEQEKY